MKMAFRSLAVALICASCSPPQQAPQQQGSAEPLPGMPETAARTQSAAIASFDAADVVFAYADNAGARLLALADLDAMQSGRLVEAVCAGGQLVPVRYLGPQEASAAGNQRQSGSNFAHEAGPLFGIVGIHAAAGGTCMLVPAGYSAAFPVERSASTDVPASNASPALQEQSVEAAARAKGRSVRQSRLLYAAAGREIAAVEFVPDGDSLLGSLVLVESGQLSFLDMPASIEKGRADGGCWRVDDDCQFGMDGMKVLAVLGRAEPLILVTLDGPEGQVILLLQARGGQLVEISRDGRYLAPV